ncbi:hypothetical protein [Rouxiella sp. Mn2063]|uniref:hypothetical protein n=1 Tax=Rouxiella sp. Mn2063 TaxID=3395262 RepID=UPI003BCAE7AE
MKILISIFLFLTFPILAATPITSGKLTQQIKERGAKIVIADLYKGDESQWSYVINKIGQGEQDWLQVAALLAPASDADSAESLATAAATAIPHNPSGVLAILQTGVLPLSPENVCSLPFYSITEPDFNKYVVDSIQALYKVSKSKVCIDIMVNTIGQSNGFVEDN